jgi:hypothetical protein
VTFSIDEVRQAFLAVAQLQENEVALPLWNAVDIAGIGVNSMRQLTLVMRACPESEVISGRHFHFLPSTRLRIHDRETVESVSVLFVDQWSDDATDIDAIAAVFLGLLEVSYDVDVILSEVISELKDLFESGQLKRLSRDEEIGLIGELLVILGAADKDFVVKAWRSGERDVFDFSSHSERVEVKTTTGVDRVHHFGSNQIPGPTDCRVIVASVILRLVEVGTTLRQLIDLIASQLTTAVARSELLAKTGSVIAGGEEASSLVFDLDTSVSSISFVSSLEVPRPIQSPGVLTMSWSALVSESDALSADGALSRAILPR